VRDGPTDREMLKSALSPSAFRDLLFTLVAIASSILSAIDANF